MFAAFLSFAQLVNIILLSQRSGCGRIPDPVVRHEKQVDGNRHILLEWTDECGVRDVMWQIAELELGNSEFNCDTRKDKVNT